ncbi:MAG: peptidyl-prolyl cis-trans isomerase [Helicobacteraceae bacterium]|nr:peptidyl-prolyl cis-trans isomerase [Helicobacteraceae bacterium]
MKLFKVFLISVVCGGFLIAAPSLVNGIAFFVNGNPVTLFDVYKMQRTQGVTQDIAVDMLINDELHKEEIKKRKIVVNDLELDDELDRIAKRNKATTTQLKSYIIENGRNWEEYKNSVKNELIKRKLYAQIVQDGIRMADENELQNYYNANKQEFMIPQSIDVTKYYSKDNKAIEKVLETKGAVVPSGVGIEEEVLQSNALNPQVVLAFTKGQVGSFTPIFPIEDSFITFLINAKNNPTLLPYENVRNVVLQKMMQQKEDYLIYEYFEKLRSNAKVNIVRLN